MIKRARLAKVHMRIISELKNEMPACFGKESKKKELIKNLSKIYEKIQREQQVSGCNLTLGEQQCLFRLTK